MPDRDIVRKTKIEILKAVLNLDPKAPVIGELSEALFEDGLYEETVQVCREGIAFHPDMLICRVVLAEALEALGRREEARIAIESARRKADQASNSLARLAGLEARLNASGSEGDAAEGSPPVDLPSTTLAELYLRQGDKQAAARVYRQLLAQDPGDTALKAKLDSISAAAPDAPSGSSKGKRILLSALERWLAASRVRAAHPIT